MKFCCWLLICALGISAADDQSSYRYQVEVPVISEETAVFRMVPTAEQLLNLGGVPWRIRIYDRRGKTVPYMRREVWLDSSEPALNPVETVIDKVRKMDGGKLEIHFHLQSENLPLHEIEIQTPVRDFEQTIDLWGKANEEEDWTRLLDNGFIFDSSRNLKAKNTILRLPSDCRCRLFRMVVSQAALERRRALYDIRHIRDKAGQEKFEEQAVFAIQPFRIDRILFRARTFQRVVRKPSFISSAVKDPQISWNGRERRTVCLLKPDFHPLAGVRIHCSDRNFSRVVSVAIPGSPEIRGRIFALDLPGYGKSECDLMLPDSGIAPHQITVTIDHGDNPSLENLSLDWLVREQEYIFLAEKADFPLTVTSTGEGADPRYDQEAVIRKALDRLEPVNLELGAGTGNVRSLVVSGHYEDNGKVYAWLLWAGLFAAVAVMAFGIVSAGRKAASTGEEK